MMELLNIWLGCKSISYDKLQTAVTKLRFSCDGLFAAKKTPAEAGAFHKLVTPSLATVAAATTVSAATAIASPAPTVSASATTGWPRLSRAGLIHRQWPTFNGLAVEFRNGVLSVLFRAHRDESKATRLAGEFILHESDFLHRASLWEKLLQFVFRRVEGEIAYV
jgi:hypothetical protein